MNTIVLSFGLAALLSQAPAEPVAPSSVKLTLLPFATLSGDVPSRAGTKAAGMLATEFKSAESAQIVEPKKAGKEGDGAAEALAAARKSVDEAKDLRKKRKFRLAEETLTRALSTFREKAAAVTDIAEVVDAYALLSAIEFNTGRDEAGQKSLATALGLSPDRDLPLAATSPLFSKVVADARKVVKDSAKATVQLESTPSGAVFLDGLPVGSTPLLVKDVPVGVHFWRIALPSGETLGGTLEASAGKPTKVSAVSNTKDPQARVLSALSQNKLDADLVAGAKEQLALAQADWLVVGALSKEGRGLALDAFLFTGKEGQLRRLPRLQFDTELLSAGVEFYNLAGLVAQKGAQAGEPVKVPSAVSDKISGAVKLAEVKYGVSANKEAADVAIEPEPTKDTGPRKPLEKVRTPLKKQ